MTLPPFHVVAPSASADGYGYSAERLIIEAVERHGADIRFVSHDWQDRRYTDPALLGLEGGEHELGQRELAVVYFLPFAFQRFRARVTLGMTMWETTRIPDIWLHGCDSTDGLIVPSEFCRRVFAERVSVPVRTIPLGVDTAFYRPVVREPGRRFVFLMAGLLHYRKGVEFALRAFREEFRPEEPVQLVLKTRRGFLDTGSEAIPADGRVQVIDEDYTREQMRGLYRHADCLLAPSRGEAVGLTPREAMATALPVILTDWGGLAEIANPLFTYPTAIDGLETAPNDCSSYGAGVAGNGDIGQFCRPSVPELRRAMRHVYEHPDQAYRKGLEAAKWMAAEWSWDRCAGKWLDAIGELHELASTPFV